MLPRTHKFDALTLDALWWLADQDGISQSAMLRMLVRRAAHERGFRPDTDR